MVDALRPRLPANVTLVHADFLDFDLASLAAERPFRVAGNLPYNVSSPILFALHRTRTADLGGILDATLMLQREVADRIAAAPGGRRLRRPVDSRRSCTPTSGRVLALPPGAFRPPPKVHSAVVTLRSGRPPCALTDEARLRGAWCATMFTQRRKTLANALAPFRGSRGARRRRRAGRRPASIHAAGPRRCNSQSWRGLRTISLPAERELCYSLRAFAQSLRLADLAQSAAGAPVASLPSQRSARSDTAWRAPRRLSRRFRPPSGSSPCVACHVRLATFAIW